MGFSTSTYNWYNSGNNDVAFGGHIYGQLVLQDEHHAPILSGLGAAPHHPGAGTPGTGRLGQWPRLVGEKTKEFPSEKDGFSWDSQGHVGRILGIGMNFWTADFGDDFSGGLAHHFGIVAARELSKSSTFQLTCDKMWKALACWDSPPPQNGISMYFMIPQKDISSLRMAWQAAFCASKWPNAGCTNGTRMPQ